MIASSHGLAVCVIRSDGRIEPQRVDKSTSRPSAGADDPNIPKHAYIQGIQSASVDSTVADDDSAVQKRTTGFGTTTLTDANNGAATTNGDEMTSSVEWTA